MSQRAVHLSRRRNLDQAGMRRDRRAEPEPGMRAGPSPEWIIVRAVNAMPCWSVLERRGVRGESVPGGRKLGWNPLRDWILHRHQRQGCARDC
jgi:hypothetical protein